jgi:hypothetical protein
MTNVQSGEGRTPIILPLKSDGEKVSRLITVPKHENISSAQLEHTSALSKHSTLHGCLPGSLSKPRTNYAPCKRKLYLDNILKEITLNKIDKQQSKRLVDQTLKSITSRFDRYQDGGIYRRQYIDAGSYPVRLKINKADEFDVNISLNIDVKRARCTGNVNYVFKDVSFSLRSVSNSLFRILGSFRFIRHISF